MKQLFLLIAISFIGCAALAQEPCLPSWHYRTPIEIDNSLNSSALVDYQLKITMNTSSLVLSGKMKADGADIRFTNAAGVILPHWIVNNTFNTASTEIWVNVDNIPPSSLVDIYMFYGKQDALSIMDGDATFLHFDNFDGSALDFGKWSFCGGATGGTIPTVSGGEVTFISSSGQYSHMIESAQSFSGPIVTEMKVNSANNGLAFIGQSVAENGYGLAYENLSSVNTMRLVSLNPNVTAMCIQMIDQSPVASVNSGAIQGLWSFSWGAPASQSFSWPNGQETRADFADASAFSQNKKCVIGSFENSGSLSVDYAYVRKYSSIVPTYTFNAEVELVDMVEATTNAPICEGDTLRLFAPSFAGANYAWVGPGGYTSIDQNPIIPMADFSMTGTYVVTVSAPTDCSPVSSSVVVELDSLPVAGNILDDTTVCFGANQVVLRMEEVVGNVVRWESATSLGGPWNTITNTTDSLYIENLTQTSYFRSIVSFGTCGQATTNVATINVNSLSEGGNIIGSADACFGFNEGSVHLINNNGSISYWESSADFGTTWTQIAQTSSTLDYSDLTDTTWYRVAVKSGVCPEVYSDIAVILIQPLPVVDFSASSVCEGVMSHFNNESQVASGTIDNYFWEFADGASSTETNPNHLYTDFGTYGVLLKAVTNKGCVDSVQIDIYVNPTPDMNFVFDDVCDTSTAVFISISTISLGSIDSLNWNYGDGVQDDLASHVYTTHGEYMVTLTGVSDSACVDSVQHEIRILERAVVDFSFQEVCDGDLVNFVNLSSAPSDSTEYSWNFGDGQSAQGMNTQHGYNQADTFQVVLQATTYGMCVDTDVDTIVIHPVPVIDFDFTNECGYDSVMFNSTTTIQWGTLTYAWDFGDGSTATDSATAHLYNSAADYPVTLEVTSDFGCVVDTIKYTEVYAVPEVSFVVSDVCRDTVSPITNTSTINSGTMTYFWDFGNGDTSTDDTPTYTFPNDGVYTILLVGTSENGCVDSVEATTDIYPIPMTNFFADSVCNGKTTHLVNSTTINTGFIDSYTWNLGDTTFSFNTDVNHIYEYPGAHDVELIAISNKGCKKDTTITIVVHPQPIAAFDFENECVFNEVQFYNESTIDYGTMTFEWQLGNDSTSVEENPQTVYMLHGFYPVQLIATSDQNCADSIIDFIEIYPLPLVNAGVDTSVSFGFWQPLEGIAPSAVSVVWVPGATVADVSSLSTEARPLENTTYTLTVTDQYGCENSDDMDIEVLEDYKLLVTNTVTPNGDGVNDTWKIYNASSFDVIHINVFDRWGGEVFQADKYIEEWDGNVELDNLPEGTYHYVIFFDQTDKHYKGSVTILR